jgi:hypothetical protein
MTAENMESQYDIFKKDSCGDLLWVEAVPDLNTARLRVIERSKREPAEYVIFCQRIQELVSVGESNLREGRMSHGT